MNLFTDLIVEFHQAATDIDDEPLDRRLLDRRKLDRGTEQGRTLVLRGSTKAELSPIASVGLEPDTAGPTPPFLAASLVEPHGGQVPSGFTFGLPKISFSEAEKASIFETLLPKISYRTPEVELELLGLIALIVDRIRVYHLFRGAIDARAEPREMRRQLRAVHRTGKAFLAALKTLDPHPRAALAARAAGGRRRLKDNITPLNESGFIDGGHRIHQLERTVALSVLWAGRALKDIPKSPSGAPGNPPLVELVKSLASIFENETGRKFSRSEKLGARAFVRIVVARAERQATPRQIEEAMKLAIRARRSSPP